MPLVCARKRRAMSADKPTQSRPKSGEPHQHTSDLTGVTAAFGLESNMNDGVQDPLLGAELNGIRVVRLIAEGGMGRVYEGIQNKPKRPVAVKIVRPGALTTDAYRRFENESEVLGRLRHPYIAQVYSAGICNVLGAQVPYFVMEFIDGGVSVTRYAASNALPLKERLDLFCKICDAVAHGHKNQVVHRDLKPSNILVDGSGLPKVIDFGVARSLRSSPDGASTMTSVGHLVGTIQYMSPEQFAGDPAGIDARTDVYALGVILYELVTGKVPYDLRNKQILEAAEIVRTHKVVPAAKLNPEVGSELGRVLQTALRKDRMHRFADAGQLCEVITRLPQMLGAAGNPGAVKCTNPVEMARVWVIQRRGVVLAGLGFIIAAASLAVARTIRPTEKRAIDKPAFTPPIPIVLGSRRYEVVFAPMTRSEALEACKARGGRLADIQTITQLKAITTATMNAGCGPTFLWANRHPQSDLFRSLRNQMVPEVGPSASASSVAIALMPPAVGWESLEDSDIAGGYVCELGEP